MLRRLPRPDAVLSYVKSLGVGRVLVGVLVALLIGGPTLGILAAADPGGVRSAVTHAVRPNSSDEDDVPNDGLGPTPDGPGGDDDTLNALSTPASPVSPTATASPTSTVRPTATASPTSTVRPTTTASPLSPTAVATPTSPASPSTP